MLGTVVDAVEHHVLDEDPAPAPGPVALAGGEDLRQGVAVVDRHQPRAQLVVRRVQGEGEAERHLAAGKAIDSRDPADGGDRGAPVADAEVGQQSAGREHGVEVHRRLPHAHEDDVVDRLDAAEVQRLVEDLVGAQVAAELHLAGGAEAAGQRAAGLRGEADRAAPVAIAHQDRLERAPVGGQEEGLDGAVVGACLRLEGEGRERHGSAEPLPQGGRQVGHLLIGAGPACRPLPHLGGAVGGLAGVGEGAGEQLAVHAPSVGEGRGLTWEGGRPYRVSECLSRERNGFGAWPCSRRPWPPAPWRRLCWQRLRAPSQMPAGEILHRRHGEIHPHGATADG